MIGNFTNSDLTNGTFIDASLKESVFERTQFGKFECGRYPDLRGHTSHVYSVAFSPDGKYLASGSSDNTIKLWSVDNKQEITTLKGHTN